MKINPLKGMKDYLPQEQRLRDYVQGRILSVYRGNGFERISTPMLEDMENLDNWGVAVVGEGVTIGQNAKVGPKAMVVKDVKDGEEQW